YVVDEPPEVGFASSTRDSDAAMHGVADGSCICGDVAYEIDGPALRMYYCHCSRCRLGRSAAHCANVFYTADGLRWLRGAGQVQDYALPGAQYFGTAFCQRCGSEVPRVSADRNVVSGPAGSVGRAPGISANGRIDLDAPAPWFEITDNWPQFAEMPPRR